MPNLYRLRAQNAALRRQVRQLKAHERHLVWSVRYISRNLRSPASIIATAAMLYKLRKKL